MTENEQKLTAHLLEMASATFTNNGCNDMPECFFEGWTQEEKEALKREYHEWNGDPEEYEEGNTDLPDWAIMTFLAAKLEGWKSKH